MELQQRALEFETRKFRSRNDKIIASREAKELILGLNQIYKKTQDKNLMDLMKRLTVIKRKVEKRLNGRLMDL
ncbi:MAG: hypothetical protein ACPGRE_01435 [Flavobacteriaceae bacterium]